MATNVPINFIRTLHIGEPLDGHTIIDIKKSGNITSIVCTEYITYAAHEKRGYYNVYKTSRREKIINRKLKKTARRKAMREAMIKAGTWVEKVTRCKEMMIYQGVVSDER
jgi:hypothetical protein